DDGFLILLDRAKDVIISGGFNIYPVDIEAELARHPAVADCAVIGVPSERWGETPLGLVVLRQGMTASADALTAFVNGR
ncbi:AMP-binding enzyme, partial [Streptomyces galilaeus]|uniref:AMP-binding enzyme n=1 Tax=Streptomyces galilaeus TaxID=33899 RepID=UPI0038F7AC14